MKSFIHNMPCVYPLVTKAMQLQKIQLKIGARFTELQPHFLIKQNSFTLLIPIINLGNFLTSQEVNFFLAKSRKCNRGYWMKPTEFTRSEG